ncbi:MAG: creatininase family protein [Pirellulaceae bacterium]
MRFHEMTSARLASIDRVQTVAVVPIAAVEQHGPHMPTGTDYFLCTAVVEALETRRPHNVLLTPTLWLGASSHHLRYGATLDAGLDNYVATLCDVGQSLLDDGFRRVLFVNGHGGNVDPLRVALRQLQPAYPDALLAGGSYWSVADDCIRDVLEGDHKFVGHACEFETSMMLHVRPELVARELLADAGQLVTDNIDGVFVSRDMRQRTRQGYTGRPDLATAEKGKLLLDGVVDRLATLLEKLLAEPLAADYEDFVGDEDGS